MKTESVLVPTASQTKGSPTSPAGLAHALDGAGAMFIGLKNLLSIPDVMAALAVCRSLVYKLMASGELPYVAVGRTRRVDPGDLQRFVEKNKIGHVYAAQA